MRVTHLTPEHEAVALAVVEFANARIRSVQQVLRIFRHVPGTFEVFQTIRRVEPFQQNDQPPVRRWLTAIADHRAPVPPDIEREMRTLMMKTVLMQYDEGRNLARLYFAGVQACLAAGAVFLMSRELRRRVWQCRAPLGKAKRQCGRFIFTPSGQGRIRRYCPGHQRLFDRADARRRVQEWRAGSRRLRDAKRAAGRKRGAASDSAS